MTSEWAGDVARHTGRALCYGVMAGGALASLTCTNRGLRLEHVLPLQPSEGVFAYARISPDGRALVYASESRNNASDDDIIRTEKIVDLESGRTLFSELGIDAYWSPDGTQVIYKSTAARLPTVSILDVSSGRVRRGVAPDSLGDYYSWAKIGEQDMILTIAGYYFVLAGGHAHLPAKSIQPCPGWGVGERPLLSKDGRKVTIFRRGTVAVRSLFDCSYLFDTGVRGAKADFSWDGRYIAFHSPTSDGNGYVVNIVDLKQHSVRTLEGLNGSALFPSWTRDGRLCFRYDGEDYRGFVLARNVLDIPAKPLPNVPSHSSAFLEWDSVFPNVAQPLHNHVLVVVWAAWSAHTPDALRSLAQASEYFRSDRLDVATVASPVPGTRRSDVLRFQNRLMLSEIPLLPSKLASTEADNQVPVALLFSNQRLVGRRLGAQTAEQLRAWVASTLVDSINQ